MAVDCGAMGDAHEPCRAGCKWWSGELGSGCEIVCLRFGSDGPVVLQPLAGGGGPAVMGSADWLLWVVPVVDISLFPVDPAATAAPEIAPAPAPGTTPLTDSRRVLGRPHPPCLLFLILVHPLNGRVQGSTSINRMQQRP